MEDFLKGHIARYVNYSSSNMMFCVVPEEMAGELYDRLVDYYDGDPNMEVIIDRRAAERRSGGGAQATAHRRAIRDRRRPRIPGEFPPLGTDVA